MNTYKPVSAGRASRQVAWLLPGIVLLAVLIAVAVRSGTTVPDQPLAGDAGAAPSALQPSSAVTAAPTSNVVPSAPVVTPLPVDPARTEAEVTQIAANRMADMAARATELNLTPVATKLESVVATRWADVGAFEPRLGVPPESADAGQIVWVARGEGTFLVTRGGFGQNEPWVGKTGYLLIDDKTGEIVGMGTP